LTTCDPMSPVPPMTAIFISLTSFARDSDPNDVPGRRAS
jgi:hypothetical protein